MNIYSKKLTEWQQYHYDILSTELAEVLPNGKHIFQILFDKYNIFPTIIEENDTHIIIIPGGYNPQNPCYEQLNSTMDGINPPSVRLGGNSSLMSLVHLLVIPKNRIYNTGTITNKDILLIKEMQKSGIKCALKLANGSKKQKYSLKWLLDGKLSHENYEISKYDMSLDLDTNINSINKKFSENDIETSFRVYPNNSIGWLHMHIWIPELATSGYDLHGHKNHSVNDIIKSKYYIKINIFNVIFIIVFLYYLITYLFNLNVY